MIKKYLMLTFLALNISAAHGTNLEKETYHELAVYFQELVAQDGDMVEIIKSNFNVSNPETIDFLMQQIDPVNLAIDIFKQYFTLEETQLILTFHTSETGRKFAHLFPNVMEAYGETLTKKIQDLQLSIASAITNQIICTNN